MAILLFPSYADICQPHGARPLVIDNPEGSPDARWAAKIVKELERLVNAQNALNRLVPLATQAMAREQPSKLLDIQSKKTALEKKVRQLDLCARVQSKADAFMQSKGEEHDVISCWVNTKRTIAENIHERPIVGRI